MPNIIGKLFSCNNSGNDDDNETIKNDIRDLQSKVNLLEMELCNDMKRIEDKIDMKFDILNNKIDTLIVLLRR